MIVKLKSQNPIVGVVSGSLVELPSPSNLSYFWNFGSLLGLSLIVQLLTGLFLAINFRAEVGVSFEAVSHLRRDVSYG